MLVHICFNVLIGEDETDSQSKENTDAPTSPSVVKHCYCSAESY